MRRPVQQARQRRRSRPCDSVSAERRRTVSMPAWMAAAAVPLCAVHSLLRVMLTL